MNSKNNVRSIGMFVGILLVLVVAIMGGIWFVKGRDGNYVAKNNPTPVAAPSDNPDHSPPQPAQKSPLASPSQPPDSTKQTPNDNANASPRTPAPDNSDSVVSKKSPAPQPVSPTPVAVPSTGPSMAELVLTGAMMMLTAYLALRVAALRFLYRQLV